MRLDRLSAYPSRRSANSAGAHRPVVRSGREYSRQPTYRAALRQARLVLPQSLSPRCQANGGVAEDALPHRAFPSRLVSNHQTKQMLTTIMAAMMMSVLTGDGKYPPAEPEALWVAGPSK